ncbi:cyclic nucleotide-gated ion channel [Curvivirga sp.]|uniref:cyclic nucleotide-gated ion channel n=1 Tax=Curvivirga sp. TaxID=2856848 RepID=UPI003B5BE5EA
MSILRKRLFLLLEGWGQASLAGRIIDGILISLILVNIAALTLSSIHSWALKYQTLWVAIEIFSVIVFTAEYLARIWVCVDNPENIDLPSWKARFKCIFKPIMIVDLLAILPLYFFLFGFVGLADMRYLRIFRVLRIMKLVRYSPAMQIMGTVLHAEKRAIFSALMIGLVVLFLASSVIYAVEGHIQPDAFGSIPSSMWWAMATLTTVGYGDVTPITLTGKIVGGFVMLMGIGVFGLWAGIMASGFSEELRRRGFQVQWQMIAQNPIFASLSAKEVLDVSREVKPVTLQSNYLILRKNVKADRVFFVVSGHVEAELPKGTEILKNGDYFGELGILHGGLTSTTFVTLDEVQLLEMGRRSFEELLARHPLVKEKILEKAHNRRHWFDEEISEI